MYTPLRQSPSNMTFLFRAHEFLADHVKWVQYPNVRRTSARGPVFKTQMPVATRVLLVLLGGGSVLIGLIALAFLGLLVWAAVTA